jgi:hypothetical protein
MELVLIAFVGTALLMAAELREFVQRRRTTSSITATSSTVMSSGRVPAYKARATTNEDLYDAAA